MSRPTAGSRRIGLKSNRRQPGCTRFPQQTFSQQAAPPSQRAKDSVEPPSPTVAPSQHAPAAQTEPDPYANLFAAATNPEEFPPVPLPIHHDFVYEPPAESTRGRSHRGTYAPNVHKPLLMWAAVLAIVCLGADVLLVKQKIAMNSRRYATDSQQKVAAHRHSRTLIRVLRLPRRIHPRRRHRRTLPSTRTPATQVQAAPSSALPSDAKSGQSTDALDHVRSSTAANSALTAQTKPSPKSASPRSQASTLDSETAQSARTGDSHSTAQASSAATSDTARRERLREYLAATAAPAATNEQPNVTRAANSNAASAPAQPPAATQPNPAPTTPTPSASSATVSAANTTQTPSASPAAPVRTQAPPPVVNSQPPAQV